MDDTTEEDIHAEIDALEDANRQLSQLADRAEHSGHPDVSLAALQQIFHNRELIRECRRAITAGDRA